MQADQAGALQQHHRGARAASAPVVRQRALLALQLGQARRLDAAALGRQLDQLGLDQRRPCGSPLLEQQVQACAADEVGPGHPRGDAGVEVGHRVEEAAALAVRGLAVQVEAGNARRAVVQPHAGRAGAPARVLDQRRRAGRRRHVADARAAEKASQVGREAARALVDGALDEARADRIQQVLAPGPDVAAQRGQAHHLQRRGLHERGGRRVAAILLARVRREAGQRIERDRRERIRHGALRRRAGEPLPDALVVARRRHARGVAVERIEAIEAVADQPGAVVRRFLAGGCGCGLGGLPGGQQLGRVEAPGHHHDGPLHARAPAPHVRGHVALAREAALGLEHLRLVVEA